ncbi:histidine phosphatase family protein [Ferrimonas sp. SCSIO 43195]|uniref:histidine phosphatase family protein n=1 Tax=Ferrimonas sp. SCSIO 43195 TaxID=2822844 RepID=UPI00207539B9|nr:histidine phosphatase family protein [Ferrimonas sp. SCSIO 43195]USD36122.1 histidine phosphatase family protein [Ferrimonas sp. SCSIO 43195]
MDLYLLRHGQAMFGSQDYDRLSDLGHRQAHCLGQEIGSWQLGPAALVSGDLRRQQQTLEGVCEGAGLVQGAAVDAGFNELEVSELIPGYWPAACQRLGMAMTPKEASTDMRYFLPLMSEALRLWIADHPGEKGESFRQFQQRITDAIATHACGSRPTVAVTSGGVISLLASQAMGSDVTHMAELIHQVNNCSITHLRYARGQWHLQAFNVNGHLRRQQMLTWR